jgi:hypothetical protein
VNMHNNQWRRSLPPVLELTRTELPSTLQSCQPIIACSVIRIYLNKYKTDQPLCGLLYISGHSEEMSNG